MGPVGSAPDPLVNGKALFMETQPARLTVGYLLFLMMFLCSTLFHFFDLLQKLSILHSYTLPLSGWAVMGVLFGGFVYWYKMSAMIGLPAYRRNYITGAMTSLSLFLPPLVLLSLFQFFLYPSPHPLWFVFDLAEDLLFTALPFGVTLGSVASRTVPDPIS